MSSPTHGPILAAIVGVASCSCTSVTPPPPIDQQTPYESILESDDDRFYIRGRSSFSADPSQLIGQVIILLEGKQRFADEKIAPMEKTPRTEPKIVGSMLVTNKDELKLAILNYTDIKVDDNSVVSVVVTELTSMRLNQDDRKYVESTRKWLDSHSAGIPASATCFRVDGLVQIGIARKQLYATDTQAGAGVFAGGRSYQSRDEYKLDNVFALDLSVIKSPRPKPAPSL